MAWIYKLNNDALDKLITDHKIKSDAAFSRKIDVTPQAVTRARAGQRHPTASFIAGVEAVYGYVPGLFQPLEVTD